MHGKSEELKSGEATSHPPTSSVLEVGRSCETWGVCWHAPESGRGRDSPSCPGRLASTFSVWIMTSPLATQGRWGLGSILLFLFALLLLKGGPFTSTRNTESLLGMCQAKQKHMVWIYSPKIEQERGGKQSSLT